MNDIRKHYDLLLREGNDPVCDPEPLRRYMDQWDGAPFSEALGIAPEKSVLEIGVGAFIENSLGAAYLR